MDLKFITPFVSIIGVICGFLLSTLKESIQNKPKIKLEMKSGNINYYCMGENELGETTIKKTNASQAEYYIVNLKLDVFNYGKGNTAIKSINVENMVNKKCLINSDVKLKESDKDITSFNLPASSIVTIDLEWRVEKEAEWTEELFVEEKISLEKEGIKYKVVARNIKNKKYKLIVEPLGIITAY